MRGVPKAQGQTCWENDGASTKDQGEATSKSVLSSCCRFCLPILNGSGKKETQKETLPVPVLHLIIVKSSAFRSRVWNEYLFVSQHILSNDKLHRPSARTYLRQRRVRCWSRQRVVRTGYETWQGRNSEVCCHQIKWHFVPPLAPHLGEGLK